mmetsp:Transcript_27939/g.64173  ORF Transcript_27939/g.64173 Transcript_27939/m.64173 type:complete len:321 (-) Transcript_27939:621-1583(-)
MTISRYLTTCVRVCTVLIFYCSMQPCELESCSRQKLLELSCPHCLRVWMPSEVTALLHKIAGRRLACIYRAIDGDYPALAADVARYAVVYLYGGIYQDVELVMGAKALCETLALLRHVDVVLDVNMNGHRSAPYVRNTNLAARPRTKIMHTILKIALHRLETRFMLERSVIQGQAGSNASLQAFLKGPDALYRIGTMSLREFAGFHLFLNRSNSSLDRLPPDGLARGCFAAGAHCTGADLERACPVGVCTVGTPQPPGSETMQTMPWSVTSNSKWSPLKTFHEGGKHWSQQRAPLFGHIGLVSYEQCMAGDTPGESLRSA